MKQQIYNTALYLRLSRDDELPVSYTHLDVYKRQMKYHTKMLKKCY